MTYGELSYRAKKLYIKGKITICEYLEMTKPLDREIEQEPFNIETYCKEHFMVMVDKDVWEKAEKAMKQEPCEDAISRENTLKAMIEQLGIRNEDYLLPAEETLYKVVKNMPSVKPQEPKTGHNCNEDYADCDQFVCSECGIELQDWHSVERDEDDGDIIYHDYVFRFCPNCGAKMESEVEE